MEDFSEQTRANKKTSWWKPLTRLSFVLRFLLTLGSFYCFIFVFGWFAQYLIVLSTSITRCRGSAICLNIALAFCAPFISNIFVMPLWEFLKFPFIRKRNPFNSVFHVIEILNGWRKVLFPENENENKQKTLLDENIYYEDSTYSLEKEQDDNMQINVLSQPWNWICDLFDIVFLLYLIGYVIFLILIIANKCSYYPFDLLNFGLILIPLFDIFILMILYVVSFI